MDDIFKIAEELARAEADRLDAYYAKPEVQARLAAQKQAEFDKGVRLGWWDAEGNIIEQPEEADEDDYEDDDEEQQP